MTAYMTKRLVLVVPTLIGAASLVFIAIRLAPGDPAAVLLGAFATPQAIAELGQHYGLDQPLYIQYVVFLRDFLTLDFGKSYATGQPAMGQILAVLPYSI
jgi:ABC-type dipeptide/oligopeptide/nickel transport system permease component